MSDPHAVNPVHSAHPAEAAQASQAAHAEHAHDVAKDLNRYLFVFGALLVGTVVTVAASYIPFPSNEMNIAVALLIATIKATLVAAIFMHLSHEKWTIYRFLIITVVFVIGLFSLTALAFSDHIHR